MLNGFLVRLECVIVNVYAPNEAASRQELWSVLYQLKSVPQIPWCIGGDSNKIKALCERSGGNRVDRNMR
ncbi:hypothetical protein RHGRI_015315 [Rhododendron griersonianum]|uniref:Uncharacterized protein n=1 Tax=Rhododendron griersonianum TaxID=479676 RepID=A0AAV6KCU0_9ERIC|nr:hypothetical protein RHGRI_015315 [Rhododendron griersonianum]